MNNNLKYRVTFKNSKHNIFTNQKFAKSNKSNLGKKDLQNLKQPSLLPVVIESSLDGILIVTEQGEWVQANSRARRICDRLNQAGSQSHSVPTEVWRVCQALIESRSLFADYNFIMESEIVADNLGAFRIRVRWLKLEQFEGDCILVTLEELDRSIQKLLLSETQK